MKIEVLGKRQLTCNHCSAVLGENSYYPDMRGTLSISLKNNDGDYEEHTYCNEPCLKHSLNSRYEKTSTAQVNEKQVTIARGMVTLDFSRAISDKKK